MTRVTPGSGGTRVADPAPVRPQELVLVAVDDALARAWDDVARDRPGVRVHRGSVLEARVDAVVSPANSQGLMRGGVDAVYAAAFPGIEQRVRAAILALHGGELPVGEAVVVATLGRPRWLISAPTVAGPTDRLPPETVHPYLAARAVLRAWRGWTLDDCAPAREGIRTIACPGLGTGVGGLDPVTCARQVAAAWDELGVTED